MVVIKPFNVEQWMDTYETQCKYNIAETCCDSVSLTDLVSLAGNVETGAENPITSVLAKKRLDYGHIRGSPSLRTNIAKLYESSTLPVSQSQVLITPGAIAANFLVFYTLVHPCDHIICIHPTYQQLYTVPESLGAKVDLWKLKENDNWSADVTELQKLIKDNTKMIILNNPNNPTGATLPFSVLEGVKSLAEKNNITVLCDEVYAPVFHSSKAPPPPSFMSLGYKNTIVTGSLSKAYSLAGIRIGWIASHNEEIVEIIAAARDYNTISVSQLDDAVAAYALSPGVRENLVERNIKLCEANLEVLDAFVNKYAKSVGYVKPVSGTTAFVKFTRSDGEVVDDVRLCEMVMADAGVLFVPGGHCFGTYEGEFRGYVRIGYACGTAALKQGLEKVGEWIESGGIDKCS
ncbi:hypothetical protein H072_2167 [Dactylellina haptotyla CBS 200.50]|uniref:Aminotransferase class I/classII large domain-containing protein n=1 Tax=Dactylellina haptotyla (strain CBS 200.50) TaxID=1284197 RepID=S8AM15_DACHA|nr:hypothetical protein H072_2167 [Dactylellina haptotyla CBS 200.50]